MRQPKRLPTPFPRKRFGQHFLEPAWAAKVLRAIDPKPNDAFIEIGPGRGALTLPLAKSASQVVAIEIDRDLAAALPSVVPPNVRVVEGDFLDVRLSTIDSRLPTLDFGLSTAAWRVAGNLPYNVASPILFKLIERYSAGMPIGDATVMLQREVADRLLAPPGGREYGVLTVLVTRHASVERLLELPPGAFRPPPKVRSSLVRLRFHPADPPAADEQAFAALVQALFSRRRKMLVNALSAYRDARLPPAGALKRSGLDGRRRPETLTVEELVRLSNTLASVSR